MERPIQFFDLKQQYQAIKQEIVGAVTDVLESGQYTLGGHVAAFERAFASLCTVQHAVAVNSGTSALHIALAAAEVGPGDEVITTPMTFIATAAAIAYTGATPVFADIDPVTYNIDPDQIETVVTSRTKAIIPVHLYGQPASMGRIGAIAKDNGLMVIEDSAQAHGASYQGRRTGSLGQMGCFSFYPSKNLGAYGEGGIVTTDDDALAERLRMLRDWGAREKNRHELLGFNMRMSGFQGAVLGVKLKYLSDWTERRRTIARGYDVALRGSGVVAPRVADGAEHVYHLYVVSLADRDAVQRRLSELGVQTAVHYPVPVHLQPAFARMNYSRGDLPHAEQAASSILSLPMYPEMDEDVPEVVATRLEQAIAGG